MLFDAFSHYLQKLEDTSSRLEMTSILADLYSHLSFDEMPAVCYLLQGNLLPSYQTLEFNLSNKSVLKTLANTQQQLLDGEAQTLFGEVDMSAALTAVRSLHKQHGDIGDVALIVYQKRAETHEATDGKKLSIEEVHTQLLEIAQTSGNGSQAVKQRLLLQLFESVSPLACKYVARIVVGKLRLGFSTMTMLDALSWLRRDDKSDSKQLESAYQKRADIGLLAQEYLAATDPEPVLAQYSIVVGIPIVPALCQRLNTATEIIEKMDEVFVEPKYDGLRVQLHFTGDEVALFSRSLENITHMFPEVEQIAALLATQNVTNCILDGEVIGYDFERDTALPFQETITRKRKHDVAAASARVPVRFFMFDLLYLNGESLLSQPLTKRKETLESIIPEAQVLVPVAVHRSADPKEIHELHEQYLAEGLEGAVVKQVDSDYQTGRKGWQWVKIKESEGSDGKLSDTLDVIVMGYYLGRGKRSQFGIGAVLVGVRDGEDITTIAKVGTGLTEEQLVSIKQQLDTRAAQEKPQQYVVAKDLVPDVWVHPEMVLEVAADELTTSSLHTTGLALRFPRLKRIRTDKKWEDATTTAELKNF